jgi:O-antigen/teichoic acid export membrane protein
VGVGGSVAVIISAPWVLSVLGGAYAAEGTAVLQFMAAAAPFTVIITTYTTLARIRRRMAQVVVVQLATAAIVISLAFLLVDGLGITGMGVAYLAGEALVTAFVLVPLVRGYRHVSPVQRS